MHGRTDRWVSQNAREKSPRERELKLAVHPRAVAHFLPKPRILIDRTVSSATFTPYVLLIHGGYYT